jgi:hypothetical protein
VIAESWVRCEDILKPFFICINSHPFTVDVASGWRRSEVMQDIISLLDLTYDLEKRLGEVDFPKWWDINDGYIYISHTHTHLLFICLFIYFYLFLLSFFYIYFYLYLFIYLLIYLFIYSIYIYTHRYVDKW